MRELKAIFILLSLSFLGGCSMMQAGKLLMPESFGLNPVTPSIYVEAGADDATRAMLRDAMEKAESAIHAAYGGVISRPIVHACISKECYESFGGRGAERAKIFGDRILLSPRGLNWHYLAHEWSHDEIRTRLSFSAWRHMPQWFDEGVAVAISEAPENSESHWQFLIDSNVSRPSRDELLTFKSMKQWLEAVHRYGEVKNLERKAKGEAEVRPVYTAAGHEVRPWLAKSGSSGLLRFIERLNIGEDFDSAYANVPAPLGQDVTKPELTVPVHSSP
jgi:hypothetical protein